MDYETLKKIWDALRNAYGGELKSIELDQVLEWSVQHNAEQPQRFIRETVGENEYDSVLAVLSKVEKELNATLAGLWSSAVGEYRSAKHEKQPEKKEEQKEAEDKAAAERDRAEKRKQLLEKAKSLKDRNVIDDQIYETLTADRGSLIRLMDIRNSRKLNQRLVRPVVLKLGAFCGVTWAEIEQKLQSESLVSVLDGYVDVCLNVVEGKLRRLEEPEKKEEPKQEIKEEPEKKEEPKQEIKEEPEKQEEKKDVGAPEQLAPGLPVAEAFPQSRQEALDRIRRISECFESIRNERRAGAALLKNSRPDLNSEASVEERKDAIRSKNILLDNSNMFFLRTMAELDGYLQYGDPSVFKKNDMKALRKLRENVEIEWNKVGDLCKKMDAETEALDARYEELRNPVGSKHSFEEAVEAFEAVQDRKLSWGRTGGHAQQFNAIKEAVREWRDPNSDKSEEEKKLDVYRACDAYLREHAGNGKTIGGQGSEVGRLRKQAVVNLLQVLSKEPALQESLQQYEAERPARVKLNFAKLEKSLAKASDAKVKLSKYEKGTQKKAYAELNTAKEQRIR